MAQRLGRPLITTAVPLYSCPSLGRTRSLQLPHVTIASVEPTAELPRSNRPRPASLRSQARLKDSRSRLAPVLPYTLSSLLAGYKLGLDSRAAQDHSGVAY